MQSIILNRTQTLCWANKKMETDIQTLAILILLANGMMAISIWISIWSRSRSILKAGWIEIFLMTIVSGGYLFMGYYLFSR